MGMKGLSLLGWICLAGLMACGQERLVFYNLENLFDTVDDPHTRDEEFTPGGAKHWTADRYVEKLRRLAQVLDSVGGGEWPAVVGVAEAENRRVLEDLTQKTRMAKGKYEIVHHDSPDVRGIDVALLYRRKWMRVLAEEALSVSYKEGRKARTRDVLYVKGLAGRDTLHFFVCHFPSMVGGEKQSEWKRLRVAELVRGRVDSLFAADSAAMVIMMGDMNGTADTPAQQLLCPSADTATFRTGELYNPGAYLLKASFGSYCYRGRWQTLDHILVSGGMLNGTAPRQASRRTLVFSAPFLLEEDKSHFGFKPFPTYRGPRYYGGYSDHLPVYIEMKKKDGDNLHCK